jgi:integrase
MGLLAVTGLRVGEAINLDRADIDITAGMLTVVNGKFGTSRQVWLHPSTVAARRRPWAWRGASDAEGEHVLPVHRRHPAVGLSGGIDVP